MTAAQRPRIPRRMLDGVLLLDKPIGLSSNDALVRAKRLYAAMKAGHTGTLDPLASGLLPLCFGEATKFSQDLLQADKTYEATMRLGMRTATGDAEGEILETREVVCDLAAIHGVLARFLGEIVQVPPMYSALKHQGKPLYEYARAGQLIERQERRVMIHALDLLTCELPQVTFRVTCSKGTYIRTLAEDIGAVLGCGAHLTALRRTAVGELTLARAVTLESLSEASQDIRDTWLKPIDTLLSTFPAIWLDQSATQRFKHGQRLPLAQLTPQPTDAQPLVDTSRVRVYSSEDGLLLGTARVLAGVLSPERLISSVASKTTGER